MPDLTTQLTNFFRSLNTLPASQRGTADFGYANGGEGDTAIVTFSAPWVHASSVVICQIGDSCDPDHDDEDAVVEGITAHAVNIVPGVQFDVMVYAPLGSWGRYRIFILGN